MKKLTYIILGIIIGALATYYFCPRLESGHTKIVKPKGVITPTQAKALSANWTVHRKSAVDSAAERQGRKVDDRSSWWSLKDIQNYLAYAQNESDSLGYRMTGIRIYLGVYGKNAGQTKKNYTTMFIVPTGKESRSEASLNIIDLQGGDDVIPLSSPLNDGGGGTTGYPN